MTLTQTKSIPTKTNGYIIAMAVAVIAAVNIFLGNFIVAAIISLVAARAVQVEYQYRKFAVEWNTAIAELASLDRWFLDDPIPSR